MNWWPPFCRRRREAKAAADEHDRTAEAGLRDARRMTQHVKHVAPEVAALSAAEFAERVAAAFRLRER